MTPWCRGCARARDVQCGFTGSAQRRGQRIADQRDVVGSVTGGVEVVCDAVGPGLDLAAHRGDGRDRGVHRHPDQQPDDGPDRDDDVADQLRQQSARHGGIRDKPELMVHAAR